MLKIGFIGAGTVGTALAVRLYRKGYPVVAVSSRRLQSAQRLADLAPGCQPLAISQEVADRAELVFITTSDDAIAQVVTQVNWRPDQSVVHCSGADSLLVLEPARWAGARVGSFHPLQTFASATQAIENLPGSTFALEAEEPLLGNLKEMAGALEGKWVVLQAGDKVLYHAAAVMASNYMVTLVKLACDLWQSFGVEPKDATQALLPLLRGTVNNLDNVGLPNCLTGPVARGDLGTVAKHLNALSEVAPGILSTYQELGLKTIPIALAKGRIDQEKAEALKGLLLSFSLPRTEFTDAKSERGRKS